MLILSMFDRSNHVRDAFRLAGHTAISIDLHPGYNENKVDIVSDVMQFMPPDHNLKNLDLIFCALPCTAYSHASGGFHFKKGKPLTNEAIKSMNLLIKIYQIAKHYQAHIIFENPSGGLVHSQLFKGLFRPFVSRICLGAFGYPTQKKTDIFSSFPLLLLNNPIHRVNGKYQTQKFDNLGYRKRITYPEPFVHYLVENICNQIPDHNAR